MFCSLKYYKRLIFCLFLQKKSCIQMICVESILKHKPKRFHSCIHYHMMHPDHMKSTSVLQDKDFIVLIHNYEQQPTGELREHKYSLQYFLDNQTPCTLSIPSLFGRSNVNSSSSERSYSFKH